MKTILPLALASALLGSVSLQAADISGVWQGGFFGGSIYMVLQQDGAKLSGTTGTSEKQQDIKLENLKLEGDRLTASMGPAQFDLRIVGETLTGDVSAQSPNGPVVLHVTFRRPGAAKPAADLKFEVASVKQTSAPEPGHWSQIRPTRGQFLLDRVTLQNCIAMAYGVRQGDNFAIVGPDWLKSEYYSIAAKIPPDRDSGDTQAMLRNLLEERFKLAVHRETREFSGYALVQAKGGFKLHEAPFTGNSTSGRGPGYMKMTGATMSMLASNLSWALDRPVEDETGIAGTYEISLTWTPEDAAPAPGGATGVHRSSDDSTEIAAALPQVGLRLEPRKLQKEIVVVDHADKVPTEN